MYKSVPQLPVQAMSIFEWIPLEMASLTKHRIPKKLKFTNYNNVCNAAQGLSLLNMSSVCLKIYIKEVFHARDTDKTSMKED